MWRNIFKKTKLGNDNNVKSKKLYTHKKVKEKKESLLELLNKVENYNG